MTLLRHQFKKPAKTIIVTSQTLSVINGGFTGFNDRLVIPPANLNATYAGACTITATIVSNSTHNGTLDEIWIGHQGITQVYNFDGGQVQLLMAGAASKAWSGALTFTTDASVFNYKPTLSLIVSTHWSGTTDTGLSFTGPASCNQFFSGASQAGATAPTGSWSNDNKWTWVSQITLITR